MNKQNNAIVVTSIIAGVILVIALLALFAFRSAIPGSNNSVTVQGISSVKAMPDIISVYFSIQTEGKTSSEVRDANSDIYDELVNNLVDLGYEESDIKTESYNIYPNVEWDNGKQTSDGYIAYHSIKLELSTEDSPKLTPIIDAGVDAGAGISYINFELSQESQNKYKAEALELAAQDAQIKADSVASGFGKTAGKLLSVSVSDFGYYPWNLYTAKAEGGVSSDDVASARETAMNLTPSEQEISASVSATFRIR